MLRNLLILPDGSEVFSGAAGGAAIQSVTVTECVNSEEELTLGSVCANMLEAAIFSPGGFDLTAGEEVTLYKVKEDGSRVRAGIFAAEKPTRESANVYKLTAYDRVSRLDRDLTQWLAALDAWPYSLYDFARMVCEACGLELFNEQIPNGSYQVQRFSADGITGRQLMQWVGQAAGRFCRATADGRVEFAWYKPASVTIGTTVLPAVEVTCDGDGYVAIHSDDMTVTDDGAGTVCMVSDLGQVLDDGSGTVMFAAQVYYYQNGLSFEEYPVEPVGKVQIKQSQEDVGTVWPDIAEEVNTYIISGNCLLTAGTAQALEPVAQTLYEQLKAVTYTPCKVSIPASLDIHAGDIVKITDRNGRSITAYVMTKTQAGQRDTLECTGSCRRDSSTAVNNQSHKALSGKVLNLRADVEGLQMENKDTAGKLSRISMDIENITARVESQSAQVDGISSSVTELRQTAGQISATVRSIQENGVSKVSNEFGLTIDESAVRIHRSGSEMTNQLNEKGMYVVRNAGTDRETTMLQADVDGVIATDVTVRNYLIIGTHARFEDYNDGSDDKRTACFYLGGS